MGRRLLHPFPPIAQSGNPVTAHHLGLADIEGGDPGDDLFLVVGLVSIVSSSLTHTVGAGWSPAGVTGVQQNLILVLDNQRQQ